MGGIRVKVVDGEDWYNGTTVWRVAYEYADARGGGFAADYFRTATRYDPPTGPEVRRLLGGEEMTVIGIERIESWATDTPGDAPSAGPAPDDARHGRVFDLLRDEPPYEPLRFDPG